MKLSIVDTHAHLNAGAFDKDRTQVITKALDSGVTLIITVGANLESALKAVELAENHQEVLAAVGFHPNQAGAVKEEDIIELAKIANHPRVVAIGEMGLDFYRNRAPQEAQLRVLKWQLELVTKLDLPVIIHCRQAAKDMLTILRDWTSYLKEPQGQPRGVIHCFNGDIETARQYLDMGFFISLGAYIGYPTSGYLNDVIRYLPLDRLVVETDSPFLPPQSRRGKRNEPAYLPSTVELLAGIRGVSAETVARETTQNAHHLFRYSTG